MNDFENYPNQVLLELPKIKKALLEEAKTKGTYGKAKTYVRSLQFQNTGNFNGSPQENFMFNVWNNICGEVITELNEKADRMEIEQ